MRRALLQVHAAVFLWGFTGVLGKVISLKEVPLVWYRLLITAASLWVLYGFLGKIRRLPPGSILYISLIGTILAMHWVCFYGSIKLANITIALTCLSTTGLLASLIEPLILKKKFDIVEIGLGLFAIAGIFLIYRNHLQYSNGIFVGLAAAVLTVLVSVLNKKMIDRYEPEAITLYQLSGGFIGLTLLLPLYLKLFPEPWPVPVAADWGWLTILSWVCTIFTFFLYIRALKKLSAFTMNLTLTLEPVYGIILAFALYRENQFFNHWFYVGFGLISVAVLFHMWRLIRPKTAGQLAAK